MAGAAEESFDGAELSLATTFKPRDPPLVDVGSLGEIALSEAPALSCSAHEHRCIGHLVAFQKMFSEPYSEDMFGAGIVAAAIGAVLFHTALGNTLRANANATIPFGRNPRVSTRGSVAFCVRGGRGAEQR